MGETIIRLIGAVLLEQDDEWQFQRRSIQVESMAELLGSPLIEGDATLADAADIALRAA